MQGFADQAVEAAEQAVLEASAANHSLTLCNTLAKSAAVALLAGEYGSAEKMIASLVSEASAHSLHFWKAEGGCLEGVLKMRLGAQRAGLDQLRHELLGFPGSSFTVRYIAFLGDLAEGLSISGEHSDAMAIVERATERSARNGERWCIAELLRIRGDVRL